MALDDPISAYIAESNMDALHVQRFLESEGVEAYVVEDNEVFGQTFFGALPGIFKPQVWISRRDSVLASKLLTEYERLKAERDASRNANEPPTIEVLCEDCGKTSAFAGSLNGTTQTCPHCRGYVDVGHFEWPLDDEDR
jgi:hypothetical protein